MNLQMSVSELLAGAKGLETKNFETLYRELAALRIQRRGVALLNASCMKDP